MEQATKEKLRDGYLLLTRLIEPALNAISDTGVKTLLGGLLAASRYGADLAVKGLDLKASIERMHAADKDLGEIETEYQRKLNAKFGAKKPSP
jgi:hypothetical protein